ncbi:MAG: hypothetical protein R8G01_03895 [Ilumatobacteraceae bacterium]|nr:hypothetical protein [Ilumatobacteraceae bacterium]
MVDMLPSAPAPQAAIPIKTDINAAIRLRRSIARSYGGARSAGSSKPRQRICCASNARTPTISHATMPERLGDLYPKGNWFGQQQHSSPRGNHDGVRQR